MCLQERVAKGAVCLFGLLRASLGETCGLRPVQAERVIRVDRVHGFSTTCCEKEAAKGHEKSAQDDYS